MSSDVARAALELLVAARLHLEGTLRMVSPAAHQDEHQGGADQPRTHAQALAQVH